MKYPQSATLITTLNKKPMKAPKPALKASAEGFPPSNSPTNAPTKGPSSTPQGGKMTISSNSELGDVKEVISVFSTGKDMTILFNSKYLLDCMKVIDDQFIKLSLTNPTSPSTITPVEGDGYLYMILPLRGGYSR